MLHWTWGFIYIFELMFLFSSYPEVELLDHIVVLFSIFLRKLHFVFHSGWINWLFYPQCRRVPFSPHPHQHLLFLVFLLIVFQTSVKWDLIVVLICILLMISGLLYSSFLLKILRWKIRCSLRWFIYLFVNLKWSLPNILKFQYHLEAAKESWGEGFRALCHQAYDRWAFWLAGKGSPSCGQGCFLCLACPPVEGSCTAQVLGCPPGPAGDLYDILSMSRRRNLWIFF